MEECLETIISTAKKSSNLDAHLYGKTIYSEAPGAIHDKTKYRHLSILPRLLHSNLSLFKEERCTSPLNA